MKRFLLMAMIIIGLCILTNSVSFAELNAGFANSTSQVVDNKTIKIFGITVEGTEGLWWAKFVWDATELKLIPIEAGEEKIERAGDCAVGPWTMTFDWDCDGTSETTSWYLFPDHNFVAGGTSTGVWSQNDKDVFLTYYSNTSYTGVIDDLGKCSYMTGRMSSSSGSNKGCFYAYRVSALAGSHKEGDSTTLTDEQWQVEKANHLGLKIEALCPCTGLTKPYCSGDYYFAGYTEVLNGVVVSWWGDTHAGHGGFDSLNSHTFMKDGAVCHDHIKAATCKPYSTDDDFFNLR